MVFLAFLLLLTTTLLSVLPLIGIFDGYFANGLTYDPKLRIFIGQVDKATHFAGIQAYYGRMRNRTLSWTMIEKMMNGMFSRDYD